jgi:hypothetical protein
MTTERKDGGPDNPPAFPPNAGWRDNDPDCRGLSMRDWFAGQALVAISDYAPLGNPVGIGAREHAKTLAVHAYAIADAMLSERQKGGAGWRPIETAPYEKRVLVYCTRWGVTEAFQYREAGWKSYGVGGSYGCEPTHWQPLPSPPEPSNG